MAWTGIVDGKCLPVVWFEGSVNSEVYLKVLKEVLWPAVRAVATREQCWCQQPCYAAMPGFLEVEIREKNFVEKHGASLTTKFS